jgi:hypothetical protein
MNLSIDLLIWCAQYLSTLLSQFIAQTSIPYCSSSSFSYEVVIACTFLSFLLSLPLHLDETTQIYSSFHFAYHSFLPFYRFLSRCHSEKHANPCLFMCSLFNSFSFAVHLVSLTQSNEYSDACHIHFLESFSLLRIQLFFPSADRKTFLTIAPSLYPENRRFSHTPVYEIVGRRAHLLHRYLPLSREVF